MWVKVTPKAHQLQDDVEGESEAGRKTPSSKAPKKKSGSREFRVPSRVPVRVPITLLLRAPIWGKGSFKGSYTCSSRVLIPSRVSLRATTRAFKGDFGFRVQISEVVRLAALILQI